MLQKILPVSLLLMAGILCLPSAQGQSARPLTQPGKHALFQRVILVPGAALFKAPGDQSPGRVVPPFSTYYVYQRKDEGGRTWLQVGSDSAGSLVGWIAADDAVNWNQTLTVAFRDPAYQSRVLLFGDRNSLMTIVEQNDATRYQTLREQAEQGIIENSPVVAIQPERYLDIRRDFYLVPILEHEDVLVGGQSARMLRVATVPLEDSNAVAKAYRTGIVFVIDSTISMGPYIDKTREVMRRVYQSITDADLSGRVSYGVVAFRDNTTAVPGLEYVTRTYADLEAGLSGEAFLAQIELVKPATVSSKGFNEDAYAGVAEAVQGIDWSGFYARYVILITDAGPRPGGDPLSTTGLDTASLQRLARDKDVNIGVFHLQTPSGVENHEGAEEQYRQLSTISGIGEFYYPVETGDLSAFENGLAALTDQLTLQVREAASGRPPSRLDLPAHADSQVDAFQNKVNRLGYGLRMRYIQERAAGGVPSLFNAWMIDRNFDAPEERALDVRVLLTRNQLSDLHEVLRKVLVTAEEGTLAPDDFLNELKSLAASISRDPEAAKQATRASGGQSLADLGYMREYLEGLPYRSEVMQVDLSIWEQWPAQRQFEFINQLDGKVAYYQSLHDNIDLWVSLDESPISGDSVYPLLLEALP